MGATELTNVGAPLWVVLVLAAVVAVGGGAGVHQFLTARATSRKITADGEKVEAEADKVNADAVQSIVSAATALVAPLERRIETTEQQLKEQGHTLDTLRDNLHLRDRLAAEHSGWDYIAEEKAREAGINLPPRPPLTPPSV